MHRLGWIILLAGCASAPPVQHTLDLQTLKDPPLVEQAGFAVAVNAVTYANAARFGQLRAHVAWMEVDNNAPAAIGTPWPRLPKHQVMGDVTLLPLPAFRVRIANSSGKTLRLDQAEVELSDGKHRWKPDDLGDVSGRVTADESELHPQLAESGNQRVLDWIKNAINGLPFVSKSVSVPSGAAWQGYLCFNVEAHDADELNRFLSSTTPLTLTLRNVTLDGTPAPPVSFTLERDAVPTTVTCPGEVKIPSFKKCS